MTTWDLTALFKNEKELEETALELRTKCQNFKNSYEKNFLNLKTDEFLKAFDIYESLLMRISKVSTYAFLVFAKDMSKGAFYAKFEDICTKAQENLLFFEIMFNEFDDAKQQNIIKASKTHGYYLSNVAKAKAHQLSVKEEQILLRTANTGSDGFARLFDETMSAMKFKFKGERLGEEEILSKLHDKDRNVRKLAAKSLSDTLAKNQHLFGYIYNMIKTSLKTSCELRNFKLPEEPRHLENQTSKKASMR